MSAVLISELPVIRALAKSSAKRGACRHLLGSFLTHPAGEFMLHFDPNAFRPSTVREAFTRIAELPWDQSS
jgi:hypothetical protein